MDEYYCIWINKKDTVEEISLVVKLTDQFIKHIEAFYSDIKVLNLNTDEYCIVDPKCLLDKRMDIALGILDRYISSENLNKKYILVRSKKISKFSYDNIMSKTKGFNKHKL